MTKEQLRKEILLANMTIKEKGLLINLEYKNRLFERIRKLENALIDYDENSKYRFIGYGSYDLRVLFSLKFFLFI